MPIEAPRATTLILATVLLAFPIAGEVMAEESEFVNAGRGSVRVVLPSDLDPSGP